MDKRLLVIVFFLINQAHAQINVMWESRFNGASNNIDRVSDMYVDASGNVYVTGSSYSTVSGFDIVTIKYNNLGVQQWLSTFNGSGNGSDNAAALAVDGSGNVYVCGTAFISGTNYDFTIFKYNSSGVLQWQVYNGSTFYDEAREITLDNTGAPIVVGGFQSTSSNTNFRTIKLNAASGATTWFQDFSNSTNLDIAVNVVTDATNNVFVTGHSFQSGQDLNIRTIKYNSSGVVQWSTQHNQNNTLNSYDMPSDIVVDASGNTFVLGTVFNGSASDDDILLLKYNTAGTVVSTFELNGSANDKEKPNALILDAVGNLYIAGRIKGLSTAEDFLVAKYSPSFVQLWIDRYNGSGSNYDEASDIVLDGSGTYLYATGYSYDALTNNDYLTIKYNTATGVHEWETLFDGPAGNSDQAKIIRVDAAGNVYVSGDSKGAGTNLDYSTIKYCQLTTTATVDNDTICIGSTVNFNVTGGAVVTWSPSTFLSCTTCSTPSASPTFDVCYQVSTQDAAGCVDIDSICVIVNPLPGPVITPDGPTTFCVGDSVGLTASGFVSYSWNTGETSSSINVDTAGTYTVTVIDGDGCANSTNVSVAVNGLPTIDAGIDEMHCQGDSTQFNATGGVSYVWNASSYLSSTTVSNPYANPFVPGAYTFVVTGTDANGCQNLDTVMLTVNPTPVAPLLFRPGSSDLIFVTNYTDNISWYQNGVYLSLAGSDPQLNLSDTLMPWSCQIGITNDYTAQYTDSNGCVSAMSAILTVDTLYSSDCYIGIIENNAFSNFVLYPNPASENITVGFNTNTVHNLNVNIFNMSGQQVWATSTVIATGNYKIVIPVGNLSNGIYRIALTAGDGVSKQVLFVKQ